MRTGLYPKLALTGIKKNGRLYIPFILTCIVMAAMHYIIVFLSKSGILEGMSGGGTTQAMLDFGGWVMALFSLIFLRFPLFSFILPSASYSVGFCFYQIFSDFTDNSLLIQSILSVRIL